MACLKNKQVLLASYTSEFVKEEDFQIEESEIEAQVAQGSGDILIQNLLISVDPWYRLCIHGTPQGLYIPQFELHKPLPAVVLGKVVSSDSEIFRVGDYVSGLATASEYSLIALKGFYLLWKINPDTAPLHYNLGVLGYPGFTAWIGIRLAQVKPGEQVFVSSAMSGVGLTAGQLAKLKGCRVVGSAGSDEKVKLLKEKFGFDDAFNYKTEENWDATLQRMFPSGIDVYLENVGGAMLEAVLNHINHGARIPISGMISQYNMNWERRYGVRNLMNLVGRCARMEGFLTNDHQQHFEEFVAEVSAAVRQGKIVSSETITDGVESFPAALVGIMNGRNVGKHLIRLS